MEIGEDVKDRANYIVHDSLERLGSEVIRISVWLKSSGEKKGIKRLIKEKVDSILEE